MKYLLAYLLLLPLAARAQPTSIPGISLSGEDHVLDLIKLLNTDAPQQMVLFRDTHFGANTVCVVNFTLSNPATSNTTLLSDPTAITAARQIPLFWVAWHFRNSTADVLSQDLPNVCNPSENIVTNGAGSVAIEAPYNGSPSETITMSRTGITMQDDSNSYYTDLFGGLYFAGAVDVTWPLLQVNFQFPFRQLSNYSNLLFNLTMTLNSATVNTGTVSTPGPVPTGASLSYNPAYNATRMEMSIPIRYHPTWCTSGNLTPIPQCQNYYNKPVNMLTLPFDERWEYWFKTPMTTDPGTAGFGGITLYRYPIQGMVDGMPAINPFKVIGTPATAHDDILPTLRFVVLAALLKSTLAADNAMPPRLVTDGVPETDDQYFADYALNTIAIGYENSGLANLTYTISAFSLTGILSR